VTRPCNRMQKHVSHNQDPRVTTPGTRRVACSVRLRIALYLQHHHARLHQPAAASASIARSQISSSSAAAPKTQAPLALQPCLLFANRWARSQRQPPTDWQPAPLTCLPRGPRQCQCQHSANEAIPRCCVFAADVEQSPLALCVPAAGHSYYYRVVYIRREQSR
jgi:hypothetical protein